MGKLDGKVAIITGGASGIGAGAVRVFAAEGARVVIADIQDDAGQALAAEIGAAAVYQRCDVTGEPSVKAAVERAVEQFGRLDVMFNNAGFIGAVGPVAEIPLEDFERTMAVLVRGVFLGTKHAAAVLGPQGSGSIISTASVAGMQAGWGPHVYSAAKAAIIQFTRSVAVEMGEKGVRVNCICPGGIATPLTAKVGEQTLPLDVIRGAMAHTQPIPRAGEPEDIARAAVWLASDDASYVTGHALVVDGGMGLGTLWKRQAPAFTQPPKR